MDLSYPSFPRGFRPLGLAFTGALLLVAPLAQADYTLSNGGSIAKVDLTSQQGMYNWSVNDQNQLNKQWFWYRVGSGLQASIDTLHLDNAVLTGGNSLTASYTDSAAKFNLNLSYQLLGAGDGTGGANITETISIHNLSTSPLDFHFYQYSDFNLLNTAGGDSLAMDFTSAYQSKGVSQIAEGIIDPNANHFEANTTDGANSTLAKLNGTADLVLNGSTSASGDVTWAYQWDVSIAPGDTFVVLKGKVLSVQSVPEPAAFSLLGLGLAALALRRARR